MPVPTPPVQPNPPGELLALTAARGIAAWWVVLFHVHLYLPAGLPGPAKALLGAGNLAVDFFFLLSGFVIQLSWGRRLAEGAPAADFLRARFARIYPLHLVMLLAFAGYWGAALLLGRLSWAQFDPLHLLLSLALVQNWGFTGSTGWNVPAWSISAELAAYLLFPLLLATLRLAHRPLWLLAAMLVALSVAVHAAFFWLGHPFPNAVAQTGLPRCLAQFAMGMIVFELYRRLAGRDPSGEGPRLSPFLAAAGLLALAWTQLGAPVMPLASALVLLGLALAPPGLLAAAPLQWLGRISYSTYLSHYFVLTLFKYALVDAPGGRLGFGAAALYLLAVAAVSVILYHGVERPAQRLLLEGRERRRAALPGPA